ncbi:MAG: hypothetical protein ACI8TX_002478 [Hyphomicrobiaceae bacterium]|jgi:hypothetical protein
MPSSPRLRVPISRLAMIVTMIATIFVAASCAEPRGDCVPETGSELGTICGFSNPEDLEFAQTAGLVISSQIQLSYVPADGAIAAFDPSQPSSSTVVRRLWPNGSAATVKAGVGDPSCLTPPDPQDFHPHGLSVAALGPELSRVAVVTHGPAERIDLFELTGRGDTARLRWQGCVAMPEGTAANDVVLAIDGSFVVSNFQPTMAGLTGLYYMSKASFGFNTGDIRRWSHDAGWTVIEGTSAANPNGVAVDVERGFVFYVETGAQRVVRVSLDDGSIAETPIPGAPDNLSFAPDGRLLVATHVSGIQLITCMLGRLPCRAAWQVWAIEPTTMKTELLFEDSGETAGGVATAIIVGERLYVGPIFGDRIGVAALQGAQ